MSRLTEFAPLSPEDSQPGVGSLLFKLFKFGKSGLAQDSSAANCGEVQPDLQSLQGDADSREEQLDSEAHFHAEGRSLQNVLKRRIRSLLALKSTGLQAYKDTDLKQYWMPDSVSKECYYCGERFTTFRRRHHCRVCGQIFCSRCCSQEIPGKIMGCTGDLRVCTYCCKVVLSYLQSADAEADLTADLRAVQEDLQTKYATASAGPTIDVQDNTTARRKTSVAYQEDRFPLGRAQSAGYLSMEEACRALQMSASLRALFDELCHPTLGISLQTHRFRLRSHHACFLGSELVQWLIAQGHASTREQGTAIGQALLVAGYLDPLVSSEQQNFLDGYALYRLVQNLSLEQQPSEPKETRCSHDAQEPLWVKQILQDDTSNTRDSKNESQQTKQEDSGSLPSSGSLFYLDLNLESNTVHLGSRQKDSFAKTSSPVRSYTQEKGSSSPLRDCTHVGITNDFLSGTLLSQSEERRPTEGWHSISQLRSDNGELQAYTKLGAAFRQHEESLLKQLLTAEGLAQSWGDVVLPLAQQVISNVRPSVRNDFNDMDVRLYVRFKKVPGGSRSECSVVNGIVCTKNVAHRAMNTDLSNPRILLLGCSVAYQRMEDRLLSLEPVMMQEFEYLRNVVARIANLEPDIVLVHRNVSRLAQEFLMDLNITLVLNVKASVLERLARCTQADIVGSVGAHIGRPQLGTCQRFHLRNFITDKGMRKTLLFFEGCPSSHLGCTVLLRGASATELAKLKRVATFLTYVEYSWRLEKSFLMDEFARPPSPPPDSFFPDCIVTTSGQVSSPMALSDNQMFLTASFKQNGEDCASLSSTYSREASAGADSMVPPEVQELQLLLLEEDVASEPRLGRVNASADATGAILSVSDKCRSTKKDKMNVNVSKDVSCSFSEACSAVEDANDTRSSLEDASEIQSCGDAVSEELKNVCMCSSKESEGSLGKMETRGANGVRCNCKTWRGRVSRDRSLTEDRRVNVESVSDFSDPLHQYLSQDDEVFASSPTHVQQLSVAEIPFVNNFRKALDETMLSASPFLKFTVPYLETEVGRNCELRKFFPKQIFWSAQISGLSDDGCHQQEVPSYHEVEPRQTEVKLLDKHQFVCWKLTEGADSKEVQTLLAQFRACGGRLLLPGDFSGAEHPPERMEPASPVASLLPHDALNVMLHQHLAVLFCSYSQESNNTPAFCVNPWIVYMDFYGHNDIPLGSFLERYCFRKSYVCPSESCSTPMLHHIRRFVHNQGCVHITLREVDSNLFDSTDSNYIFMWSLCSTCKSGTPVVRMSDDTWSFSFAKYLELRFHGHMYRRRGRDADCGHSLHCEHYQYFSHKNIVVSFKYTSVVIWEVCLPPSAIELICDPWQQSNIIEDVKQLALKGYEVYCYIMDRLSALEPDVEGVPAFKQQLQKEQAHFKSCIEEVQLKLTSPTLEFKKLEGQVAERDVQQLMWNIEDSLVHLKKLISDAVSSWNCRIQDLQVQSKKKRDGSSKLGHTSGSVADGEGHSQSHAVEDDTSSCSEGRESPGTPGESCGPVKVVDTTGVSLDTEDASSFCHPLDTSEIPEGLSLVHSLGSPPSQVLPPEMSSTPEERHLQPPLSDKKSVKNILSQLLPSTSGVAALQSPLSSQEHHLSSYGCTMPVIVYENEPSSIIAYALSSQEYLRSLCDASVKKQPSVDQHSSSVADGGLADVAQHSSTTTVPDVPDKSAESEEKKAQPTIHIEVQFSDATSKFHCLVYYAEQFSALRQSVIPDGEESYLRSLSRCVQWAARGGKSGSTFCKTKDDRYIIKEMSKLEKDLFLEFAPNYFGYMQKCHSSNQPTLLGKIVGVYRVVYRNMTSNATLRSILLVMENLFYGRTVTHKFDLKGSVRNRLANTTLQQEGEIVLLDENLLKMTCDSPLYILPHSKTVLTDAINNDTLFLSSQSVIDYSLLVGLDQERLELVVGIIDYIRTFTWDKKLETMVKSSGILGGQGKQPTVVSPELYRARFIAAMHKYFLPVPDRWMGLGKGIDC